MRNSPTAPYFWSFFSRLPHLSSILEEDDNASFQSWTLNINQYFWVCSLMMTNYPTCAIFELLCDFSSLARGHPHCVVAGGHVSDQKNRRIYGQTYYIPKISRSQKSRGAVGIATGSSINHEVKFLGIFELPSPQAGSHKVIVTYHLNTSRIDFKKIISIYLKKCHIYFLFLFDLIWL